jgi:hypothetical protein
MKSSDWRALKNERALARLQRALPAVFPGPVLAHALAQSFIPPTPRLAVDRYWRAHPLRADRLARALAARRGTPEKWTWRLGTQKDGLPASFRSPPAPYREPCFALGPGACCVCGQPVYRLGWHRDLWAAGPNRNASWHTACVVAWQFWNAPSEQVRLLKRAQGHRCAVSDKRLLRSSEVDHRVPLFRVWREHRDLQWPQLLRFWGAPNLQVINSDAHAAKCQEEAQQRRRSPMEIAQLPPL